MIGKKVYVLGGTQSDFQRNFTKEGKIYTAVIKELLDDGLRQAGIDDDMLEKLKKDNKVACCVGNFIAENYAEQGHLGPLITEAGSRYYDIPTARYENACASGSVALDNAISRIRLGDYDLVIVLGWEIMKTVSSVVGGDYIGKAAIFEKEVKGQEFPLPKLFSALADTFIEKYKLDEARYMDNIAWIAANNYENARRNPNAQTRNWFMDLETAKNRGTKANPIVGGRLAISDCSQITDGGAVVILASEDFIKKYLKDDIKEFPIVKGFGHRTAPMSFDKKMAYSLNSEYVLPLTRQAIVDAYNRADLTVNDIDVFETHDCFSSSEYAAISAFGLTEPGKEYEAIEDGRIFFDGNRPINPSGGLIGGGHPIGGTGVRMFLDLYKQVTGTASGYQVKNVRNAAMLNIGGSGTTNYSFIVGEQ